MDQGAAMEVYDGTNWHGLQSTPAFGHMGMTMGFLGATDPTDCFMDAAQILRGGMVFSDGEDALIVPTSGLYRITGQVYASGADTGPCIGWPMVNGTIDTGLKTRFWKEAAGTDQCGTFTGVLPLVAGDKVTLRVDFADNIATWGTTGWNGSFLEVEQFGPIGSW
jgi:hypothetical protein